MIQVSTKGLREAVAKLQAVANAPKSRRFQEMLIDSVEPVRQGAINNVHSITGRTVSAIVSGPGKGAAPSAFVKVEKSVAYVMWGSKRLFYPAVVEAGHVGKHPAVPHPFFRNAIDANRAAVRRLVNDGSRDVILGYAGSSQIGGEFA